MNKYISTFCLCATLLIFSCTDPNLIGLDVQPPSDGISVLLTSNKNNLKLSTISEETLETSEANRLLLGKIDGGSVFGDNVASFVTQILLPSNNIDTIENVVVDSVILSYTYTDFYGDLDENNDFVVQVYEIDESIFKDSVYSSNYSPIYSGSNLALSNGFSEEDSTQAVLNIRIDNSLGEKLIDASGLEHMVDNVAFLEFFKGLYVSAFATNTIVYLNLTQSKLSVYYHEIGIDTAVSFDFNLGGEAARINIFNEKDMSQLLQQADTFTYTYVQSMAGYKTVIEIQHLDTLKSFFENKAINRVNLSFELDGADTADFPPHGKLHLRILDTEEQSLGVLSEGGNLENGNYSFNITQYFFSLLFKIEYSNRLYLEAEFAAANANRTILIKDKISFNIIYTDL